MLPALLESLQFRSDNRFQPIIEALAVIRRHLGSHRDYLSIISHPNKKKEGHGLWALAKLEPQSEPQSLGLIKKTIGLHYGILDLLDVFVEADRIVEFTRFFTHSGI